MKVFKFGGASLKSAAGIRNATSIIQNAASTPLLVVVSAMGKTTDNLELVLNKFSSGTDFSIDLDAIRTYHQEILQQLPGDHSATAERIVELVQSIPARLAKYDDPDCRYDQVICIGELISSIIVHSCLQQQNLPALWVDAREYLATDARFREGRIDWKKTSEQCQDLALQSGIQITQGFIGRASNGLTTTLGRDGSDYSAGIFASCLNAESVTIWKDVPGVMNADPRRLPNAQVFPELPYREAAEMTYYGASIIHPKTIKPLANRNIPLWVKNYDNPELPGTIIHECKVVDLPPLIVFKDNQCLISCKVTDFTFVSEQQLTAIFNTLYELDLRVNLMQNSAISFSFCVDYRESKVMEVIRHLQQSFEVYYNTGLTLVTIKNYDKESFHTFRQKPGIILEQTSRSTLQLLMRNS